MMTTSLRFGFSDRVPAVYGDAKKTIETKAHKAFILKAGSEQEFPLL
jgi:hypothetical protein